MDSPHNPGGGDGSAQGGIVAGALFVVFCATHWWNGRRRGGGARGASRPVKKRARCSAPGKVLIVGGYAVLEHPNPGLVLAVSARFYSSVSPLRNRPLDPDGRLNTTQTLVVVNAPQRHDSAVVYQLDLSDHFHISVVTNSDPNKFVEYSIRFSLMTILHIRQMMDRRRDDYDPDRPPALAPVASSAAKVISRVNSTASLASSASTALSSCEAGSPMALLFEELRSGIQIDLKADQEFYGDSEASKTGLGSSATLVSSLVNALFVYFDVLPRRDSTDECVCVSPTDVDAVKQIACNVAQMAHCAAQGKVGSGFDVSTAFYGSQVYTRWDKAKSGFLFGKNNELLDIDSFEFASNVGCRELQQHLVMEYHDSSSEQSSVIGDYATTSASSSTPLGMPPHSRTSSSASSSHAQRSRSRASSTHNSPQMLHSTPSSSSSSNGVTMKTNGSVRSQQHNDSSTSSNGVSNGTASSISASRLNKHNSLLSSSSIGGHARSPPVSHSSHFSSNHLRPPLPFDDMKDFNENKHQDYLFGDVPEQFQLPPGIELVLGDVRNGSETPGMVRKVLNWRKTSEDPSHIATWTELLTTNRAIIKHFSSLVAVFEGNPRNYTAVLDACAKLDADQWPRQGDVGDLLAKIRSSFQRVRHLMKTIGHLAGTDIEPDEQTELLDETIKQRGVLAAAVPGAGGHDAVFALTLSAEAADRLANECWRTAFKDREVFRLNVRCERLVIEGIQTLL